ncbi:MAG TPA: type 1 glutamine amidotransferase [Burkholderiales bacterium]|nr:type 1 glutamine amidotransferase [Burkholderiales bacterium]
MKPVAIFRFTRTEGPGYFATFLDAHRIPWRLVKAGEGEAVPAVPSEFSGLVLMGGPMSVNDDLPWIRRVLGLVNEAVDADIPVLGHCLGGQLMSKALGGKVTSNGVKEIGWGPVAVADNAPAREWFGATREFSGFHWHGETFTIPPGATRIAESAHCANQVFALGKHLGMQCHVEMTPELIRSWCEDWEKELVTKVGPSVQTPAQMIERLDERVRALNLIADRVYDRWIEGLQI